MSKPVKWTLEKLQEEAIKYNRRVDFQNQSCRAYLSARRQGLLDKVCAHMEKSATKKYTDEEIINIAKQFNTRSQFQKNSKAYASARLRGKNFLNSVCSHMTSVKKVQKHTKETTAIDALKYKTKREWCVNDSGSYLAAVKNGWVDDVCGHMVSNRKNSSKEELIILEMVKKYFPDAVKKVFKNENINFRQSKYELDIYIPSLKKGIEYDGSYWHSDEVLAKSKKITIEEAKRYHEEKDEFFASLGVEVLHIKEKHWTSTGKPWDERKILSFLGLENMLPGHKYFRYIWAQNPNEDGEF